MALTVTIAGASSDSYATLAEANAFLEELGGATDTAWDALTDTQKESYLKRAARLIDQHVFRGYKYDCSTATAGQAPGQALAFPRHFDLDGSGDEYVPTAVKHAQIEIAVHLMTDGQTVAAGSDHGIKSFTDGDLAVEFADDSPGESAATRIVRQYLGNWLAGSAKG